MSSKKKIENEALEEEQTEEKKKFKLIDIFRNKRYYAIANLVFWFGVLLILIIIARITPPTSSVKNPENDLEIKSEFSGFSYIKNKNFNFKYTLSVDNGIFLANNEKEIIKTIFEGKEYNSKILFKDNKNSEFFIQDKLVLKKENNNFVLAKNPCEYFDYTNVDLVEKILLESTQDTDGGYILPLNKYLELIGVPQEVTDKTIYIDLTKDERGIITKIEMDLSEYISLTDSTIKSVELKLEYSSFGEIEDFDIKN